MSEETSAVFTANVKNQEEVTQLMERLFEVVDPETVFSKPKKVGEYTLITASEVIVGLGAGYGYGYGHYSPSQEGNAEENENVEMEIEIEGGAGGGGGGGGGGMSSGRPVAVISVGPEGVVVHPVIDRTKLGIALISAIGSMYLAFNRFGK